MPCRIPAILPAGVGRAPHGTGPARHPKPGQRAGPVGHSPKLGLLAGDRPNLLWFTFTDERARDHFPDGTALADQQVAELHQLRRGDRATDDFADRLSRTVGAPFTHRWKRRPVAAARTGIQALRHPEVGPLRLTYETLDLTDADLQRIVVHLPADAASTAKLDRLLGRRPGQLRSVAG